MRVVQAFQTAFFVTLMEMGELDWAGPSLNTLGNICNSLQIKHLYLPIKDEDIPDASWEQAWRRHGPDLHGALQAGRNIVFHCRGGRGRAGLAAARMLIELGAPHHQAIAAVRAARSGTIETQAQEDYLRLLGQ